MTVVQIWSRVDSRANQKDDIEHTASVQRISPKITSIHISKFQLGNEVREAPASRLAKLELVEAGMRVCRLGGRN